MTYTARIEGGVDSERPGPIIGCHMLAHANDRQSPVTCACMCANVQLFASSDS